MITFSFLRLNGMSIFEQLKLEEALLRSSADNWCLINTNAPPAIVMGISGKPEKLLNIPLIKRDNITLIKRFSGGGTVYIDEKTVLVTFICNSTDTQVHPQPKAVLQWSEQLYKDVFPGFQLCENDYAINKKKFGGNAQYLQKSRWLLHTSFLWDFELEKMEYLLMPETQPAYRALRNHDDFLCKLKSQFPCKESLIQSLCSHFASRFLMQARSIDDIETIVKSSHRQSTTQFFL